MRWRFSPNPEGYLEREREREREEEEENSNMGNGVMSKVIDKKKERRNKSLDIKE